MGKYGEKVRIRITGTSQGMNAEIPIFDYKGRKVWVGYKLILFLIEHGWVRHSDLLYLAMFKNFNEFGREGPDKEIKIHITDKENSEENGKIPDGTS